MIIVASTLARRQNRNLAIVNDLVEGFAEIVGSKAVIGLKHSNPLPMIEELTPALLVLVGSPGAIEMNFQEVAIACRRAGTCLAFWTVEDPYEFDFNTRFTRVADIVFTNDIVALPFYDRADVHHLPLAAKIQEENPADFITRPLDFFFCGVAFPNRQALIRDLLPVVSDRQSLILGDNWPNFLGDCVINRRISSETLLEYYRSSRCVLNVGRDLSIANSLNLQAGTPGPRTFEAAMAGCVQIYHRPGSFLSEYFKPGEEILSFNTIREFRVIFEAVISDSSLAQRIASAARSRVLADHTFMHRARTILEKTGISLGLTNSDNQGL